MTIDAEEVAIRNLIAIALAEHGEANGRGVDALLATRQGKQSHKAVQNAGLPPA
jgi:hypothetical protein